ncbi:MAG: hypothetical protein ABIV25_06860, partial [Paracoccaceae bacterium]
MTSAPTLRQPSMAPFLWPTVVVLGVCTLYPIGYVIWISFFKWSWAGGSAFVGLKNYNLLWLKDSFRIALGNTFYFSIAA